MYCKCSIFTTIKLFFFQYGNYTNYLSLPCANYLCIHPFRLYPEQRSSLYFYRKRTWNTRVKLSATGTTVQHFCNGADKFYEAAQQPTTYLLCFQAVRTSLSLLFLIFSTENMNRFLYVSTHFRNYNDKTVLSQLFHPIPGLAHSADSSGNHELTSSINFCFNSKPFFAVFVNETVEGKMWSFHSGNTFKRWHVALW